VPAALPGQFLTVRLQPSPGSPATTDPAAAPAAPAGRSAGRRAGGLLRAQRPVRPWGCRLRKPARPGGGVRRADAVVVPHRCVPQLRERAAVGRRRAQPRAGGRARGRQRPDLVGTPPRRGGARPLGAPHDPPATRT
jgi:hypothetical protein